MTCRGLVPIGLGLAFSFLAALGGHFDEQMVKGIVKSIWQGLKV